MREAAKLAGMNELTVIDEPTARAACDEWRKEFEITMTGVRRDELEYIELHGEPKGGQVSHELLLWNYAIPYANGDMWFAPNPLIRWRPRFMAEHCMTPEGTPTPSRCSTKQSS